MLPPYVIGCTARDGHVVRGLNRYERAFGLGLSVVHVLQTFLLVLLCVFFCCLLVFVGVVVGVLCPCRTVLISVEVSLTAYQIMMWRKKLTVIVIRCLGSVLV